MRYIETLNDTLYDTFLFIWTATLDAEKVFKVEGSRTEGRNHKYFDLLVKNVEAWDWQDEAETGTLLPINVILSGSELVIFSVQSGSVLSLKLQSEEPDFELIWHS